MTFRVTLRGQDCYLGLNGWLHWIQEVKIYRNRCINLKSSYFIFFSEIKLNIKFNKFKLAKIAIFLKFFFCYLFFSFIVHIKLPEKCYEKLSWGGWSKTLASNWPICIITKTHREIICSILTSHGLTKWWMWNLNDMLIYCLIYNYVETM